MSQSRDPISEIEQLVDELESFAERSPWYLPHKIAIHEDEFFRVTQRIRELLPAELADAKDTLSKRDLILKNAQEEHRRILESAERRLHDLTSSEQVTVLAQQEAMQVIENAVLEAETLKRDALLYTTKLLADMEDQLVQINASLKQGREILEEEMTQQVQENLADVEAAASISTEARDGDAHA
jgi:cell division septum initiation protein DivIVA